VLFVGVDWAERHNDLCLLDEQGAVLAKRRIADRLAGVTDLHALVARRPEDPGHGERSPGRRPNPPRPDQFGVGCRGRALPPPACWPACSPRGPVVQVGHRCREVKRDGTAGLVGWMTQSPPKAAPAADEFGRMPRSRFTGATAHAAARRRIVSGSGACAPSCLRQDLAQLDALLASTRARRGSPGSQLNPSATPTLVGAAG
jgi:hypothetical protein